MRQQNNLFWPLSITFMGLFLIVLILAKPDSAPLAAPLNQTYPTNTPTSYPSPTATEAVSETATAGTETPTDTPTKEPDKDKTPTKTNTPDPTDTPVPKTPTPTYTPTPEEDVRVCVPGVPVIIEGDDAPPEVALELYFGRAIVGDISRRGTPERDYDTRFQVVGGGLSDSTGHFRMTLTVGKESPGTYPLKIQVRGSKLIVKELTCLIGVDTPTPEPPETDET